MALSTKSIYQWAGSIRQALGMDAHGDATSTAVEGPASLMRHDPIKSQTLEALRTQGIGPPVSVEGNQASSSEWEAGTREITASEHHLDQEAYELNLSEKMELEKKRYPGASEWAQPEERLFELFYLRQDLPMMPSHWHIDFRGVPMPENIFNTTQEHPPIIYAHSKNGSTEYSATAALTRLIDLTLAVRTLMESHPPQNPLQHKRLLSRASVLIKDRLDEFLAWAARDGGYDRLQFVPNIVTEIVDAPGRQEDIVNWMRMRMKSLGALQREFLRKDQDSQFWMHAEPWLTSSTTKARRAFTKRSKIHAGIKRRAESEPSTPELTFDELSMISPSTQATPTPQQRLESSAKKRLKTWDVDFEELARSDRVMRPRISTVELDMMMDDEDEEGNDNYEAKSDASYAPSTPSPVDGSSHRPERPYTPPPKPEYRRQPPVIYGLYILGTSVFILTADSSKGDLGYVSFHLDINFDDSHQSVWNALTVAIAVCSARDELMGRRSEFAPAPAEYDSDPDA